MTGGNNYGKTGNTQKDGSRVRFPNSCLQGSLRSIGYSR